MDIIKFNYPAKDIINKFIQIGHVGSGDLEIILEPNVSDNNINIGITSSVDNRRKIWELIFNKIFSSNDYPAMQITIADFGATPGVISLRLHQALEQLNFESSYKKVSTDTSFVELDVKKRALSLLDHGSSKELMGFEHNMQSPWLGPQGIVSQSNDGCIVIRGDILGKRSVVIGIDGIFQGGAIGEISGAKMAAALELALLDAKNGTPTQVVLLLETGGVRLQEANLGLAAIADIHAAIIELRKYIPVIGIISGSVGCFGGMSIAAALCSVLIVTQEGRLGLNGPQVIEQEAGVAEYDSRNKSFIWQMTGGEQRFYTGFVDYLVPDNASEIKSRVQECISKGVISETRCQKIEHYISIFDQINASHQATQELTQKYFDQGKGDIND